MAQKIINFIGEGDTIEDAISEAMNKAMAEYIDFYDTDFEFEIVQYPIKKLFKNKRAIVQVYLNDSGISKYEEKKKQEEEEALKKDKEKKRAEKKEKLRKIEEEYSLLREKEEAERIRKNKERAEKRKAKELEKARLKKIEEENKKKEAREWEEFSNENIDKLRELINVFPTLYKSNMLALYNHAGLYVSLLGDALKMIGSENINSDLKKVWSEMSKSSFAKNLNKNIKRLFIEIVNEYEDISSRSKDYEIWGYSSNYNEWLNSIIDGFNSVESRTMAYYHFIGENYYNFIDEENNFLKKGFEIKDNASVDDRYKSKQLQTFRLFILTKYFQDLYLIPFLYHDLENAKKMRENEELTKLIINKREACGLQASRDIESYDLYTRYYKNDIELDEPDFRNAGNILYLYCNNKYDRNKDAIKLKEFGIDVDEILNNAIANIKEEQSIWDYIACNYLEIGRMDNLVSSSECEELWSIFTNLVFLKLCENENNISNICTLTYLLDGFNKAVEDYSIKYKLLHMTTEEYSKVEQIKAQFRNAVTGQDFENVLKLLYEYMGYEVKMTKTTGDQGADLIIKKHGVVGAIQAKYYSSQVGNSAVQEIVAAMNFYGAQKGFVITNSTFTKAAYELAEANNIELIDGAKLDNLIQSLI